MHCSRSHDAVIRIYDAAGNVIETHEYAGDFKESVNCSELDSAAGRQPVPGGDAALAIT
jgi:hypothetical protein